MKLENIYSSDKLIMFILTMSWFLPIGIGIRVGSNILDLSIFLSLISILLFILCNKKIIFAPIDKVFVVFILMQFAFSIFYLNPENQILYLFYYTLFFYFFYFIGRSIFYKKPFFLGVLVRYISIMIVFSIPLIYFHFIDLHLFDSLRGYEKIFLENSHNYNKTINGNTLGNGYLGHMVAPDQFSQFNSIIASLLIPFFLLKNNTKFGIIFSIFISSVVIFTTVISSSRVGLLVLIGIFLLMNLLSFKKMFRVNIILIALLIILSFTSNVVLFISSNLSSLFNLFGFDPMSVNYYAERLPPRIGFYNNFFSYITSTTSNFIFGYGSFPHLFNSSILGNVDLAWSFSSFLEKGLLVSIVYSYFYILLANKILRLRHYESADSSFLFKLLVIFFGGVFLVSLANSSIVINSMYFFILGAIVSLLDSQIKDKPLVINS
jgi:hypothetical protein